MRLSRVIGVVALACTALAVPLARAATGTGNGALFEEKIAMAQRIERAQSDAYAAVHGAKDLAVTVAESIPEPAWLTGIISSGHAPLPGSTFEILNQWHDLVNSEHVNVYAGGLREQPEVGVLVVDVTPVDPVRPFAEGGVYPTPERTGAVRIVDVAGTRLVLSSSGGARFFFDLATRTYL